MELERMRQAKLIALAKQRALSKEEKAEMDYLNREFEEYNKVQKQFD